MSLKMKRILVIILTLAIISGNVAFAASSGFKGSGSFSGVSNDNATVGEQNALRVGRDYLDAMGFSYEGLIEQLEYEGFSHEEAVYACNILFEKSDLPVKKGSKGEKVKEVQAQLVELGFLSGGVDGIFGGGTEKAVKAFQTDRGLDVTGIVDENTYEALYEVIDLEENSNVDIAKIMDTLMGLPKHTAIAHSDPVEEGGATAYAVKYGGSMFYVMFNPDNEGKFTTIAMPQTLDAEKGSQDLLDFLAFLSQAVSGSNSSYDMYACVMQAIDAGKYIKDGIEYAFSDGMFTINY